MHYSNLIKCSVHPISEDVTPVVEETVEPIVEEVPDVVEEPTHTVAEPTQAESEMLKLLREMSERQQPMPEALEECTLTQPEVDMILETVQEFHEKYFPDIPLSRTLEHKFVFNIPKVVADSIIYIKNHPEVPDVMNLTMMLYLFFTDVPFDAVGRYLEIMFNLIDGSREAINEDSQAYLADAMEEDDEDE